MMKTFKETEAAMPLTFSIGGIQVVCRRKTKTERELVADIHKTFQVFCHKQECWDCPYAGKHDCVLEYVKDLLDKGYEPEFWEDEE